MFDHNHEKEDEHRKHHDEDCVCEIVKKIHEAQEAAADRMTDCGVSCERSIKQLLSPTGVLPTANTIPFTLDCGCESKNFPYIGKAPLYDSNGVFCLIFSPFFKVNKIKDHCCAVLELLWPTCDGVPFSGRFTDGKHFPCFEFNGFIETGACINVDLNCFCSISCHNPTMTQQATPAQIHTIIKAHKCSR